ncbi:MULTISPECIES: hypothetical protein [unclassified Variovorax]
MKTEPVSWLFSPDLQRLAGHFALGWAEQVGLGAGEAFLPHVDRRRIS